MGNNGRVSDLIDTTEMYLRTDLRARGGGHRPPARPDRRAAAPERAHGQPDRGPDGARRAAHRRGRPPPAAHRRGPQPRDAGDAQAPARRAAAHRRDRARLGAGPRGGVPLGARDERDRRAPAARAARPPDRVAVRQPDPGSRRARRGWATASSSATASSRWQLGRGRRLPPGAGAPDQRGDAEGRDPDGRPASRRRDAGPGDRRDLHARRACCWAAQARLPRSCPRPPSTSSSRPPEASRRCPPHEPLAAPRLDLDGGEVVAPGHAAVHDDDRQAGLGGVPHEAQAAHHGQRRARRRAGRRRRRWRRSTAPRAPWARSPRRTRRPA